MDSLPISTPDHSPGTTTNSVKSDDSSPRHDPGRGSPPPNCAICLGTCRNKSFTDSCLHQFCFKCLLTWSKVKAECPLCKQNFRSIIHNVRSNHQYEEYMVEQRHTEELSERIDIDNFTASRRFRYRTTLTLPRQNTIAIQQLLLHHYPMVAELFPGPPAPRRRSPASFRRTVYRYNLWARPLPDFTSRFRDCSPGFYRHNPSQMHRLVPWLNRELHYLLNENVGHIAYVVARILELLPQYCINSTEFRDTMRRYFGDNTDHFLHELYCFASTPYDMNGYDRHVQYTTDHTISTIVNDVLSSSESDASVDSDIVMISSSAPADAPPGPSRPARPPRPARSAVPVYPQSYITDGDGVIPIETISQSDTDDDSSEVMVVGYIKPPQDRTPEVVDLLGSDSDVIVQEGAPPEPEPHEAADGRAASLVKLTLARHAAASDGESARTPSASPPRRPRRARSGATPEPPTSSTSSSSDSDFDFLPSLSDSEEDARRKAKWKTSRRKPGPERSKRRAKRRSRKHRKNKRESNVSPSREKQGKHKSHSGKGVKSSKKCGTSENETAPVHTERVQPLDQPGTSGLSRGETRDVSHDTNAMSYGTSEIFRNASEISNSMSDIFSRFTGEMSHGTSEILSRITSEMSRGTSELSSSTNDITRNEVSRAPTKLTHSMSQILSSTNDISSNMSEVSHGTSEISRSLSEMSRGSCGISRGTRGTSHSASDISPGTSELSRGTNDISCGISEPWRCTKRKLERNTRRRESKRLKSVVNVVKRQKISELASPVGAERATDSDSEYKPTDSEPSDSDDDLPLNLSIVKGAR